MLTAGLAALEGNNSLTLNSSSFNHKEVANDNICQLQSSSNNLSAGSLKVLVSFNKSTCQILFPI